MVYSHAPRLHSAIHAPRRPSGRYCKNLVTLVLVTLLSYSAHAAEPVYEFPLADLPFNATHGGRFPSMAQSLALSQNYYQFAHIKIADALADRSPGWFALSIVGFDILSTWVPLGDSWVHEEWHRAVLSRRGINSYDEVNNFPLFSDAISVSHVTDEDLTTLKRDHPADLVRLHAAGLEAQNEMNARLERDKFFNATRSFDGVLLWLNVSNTIGYLHTCATPDANTFTDAFRNSEGSDISKRDFAGLDCTAWVYDLLHPNEPYSQRGTHPSGTGIDRYRAWRDLAGAEQNYLRRQRNMSLLNLVDPFLFGHNQFLSAHPATGAPLYWNTSLRHDLTPFGYALSWNLFLRDAEHAAALALRYYAGHSTSGMGVELSLPRIFPDHRTIPLVFSARIAAWQQPQRQYFYAENATLGGDIQIRLTDKRQPHWNPFVELEGKSAGWVAGNEYLGANIALRAGLLIHY